MLVVEGTCKNGQLQLDTRVAYQRPARVKFLDELSAAVRPPTITAPVERMHQLQASGASTQSLNISTTDSSSTMPSNKTQPQCCRA